MFGRYLDSAVGYALPIERNRAAGMWRSGPWFLRDDRLYLMPGDSPMGYRLPLDSLPWVAEGDYPYLAEPDPSVPRARLSQVPPKFQRAAPDRDRRDRRDQPRESAQVPARFESATWIVRSAMCAEARGGVLYIFMPPVAALEDYLDLVAVVEATAADLGLRIALEGYPPAYDSRLKHFPSAGSRCHRSQVQASADGTIWYAPPRVVRRGAPGAAHDRKFMLDGRHTGTGGGNHFARRRHAARQPLPAPARPSAQSDFAGTTTRRSYLFSALFIGPTSQAPRVDEARTTASTARNRLQSLPKRALCERRRPVARRSRAASSAGRRVRQHASRGVLHRQDDAPDSASGAADTSSSARSRCRRTRT